MRLAVVVGHDPVRRGARGRLPANQHGHEVPGLLEFDANLRLARQMEAVGLKRGWRVRAFVHSARTRTGHIIDPTDPRPAGPPSYRATVQPTIDEVNAWRPDAVVELHFNSVPRLTPDGLRMRDWGTSFAYHFPGSPRGERIGRAASAASARVIGSEDRGSLPRAETWAGAPLRVLQGTRAPAILIESHNGANYAHHARFVEALAHGLLAADLTASIAGAINWS